MRVLLINPFYPISETPSPPLGLAYLAAALEEAGFETRVLDYVVYAFSEEMLKRLLEDFQPRVVGITAVSMTVDSATAIIEAVKGISSSAVTVMGGPHATFCARETLAACPALDLVVLGEGERTVVDVSRAVRDGASLECVRGIALRSGAGVHFTPRRGLVRDLDLLPPPSRRHLPLGRYRALGMPVSMTTSRGCPHKCIFCVGRKMVGPRLRYRRPEKVVDELAEIAAMGFHQVNIADDLFTADKRRCMAVCDEILLRGLRVTWTSFARVDTVSEELLRHMRAAGCTAVSFGIESANRGILKTVKKRITPEQAEEAVRMCKRAGVTPFASFILGLPGETPDTLRETIEFGKRLQEFGLVYGFHLLAPFPGTEVHERCDAYGIRILTHDWSLYHANRAVAETRAVSRQMLDAIAVDWEDRFNRYLGDIQNRMAEGRAAPEEVRQFTNLERITLVYDLMMKNTIEKVGTWRSENGSEGPDNLDILIRRVAAATSHATGKLRDALAVAAAKGDLVSEGKNGQSCWRWRDYL